MSDGHRWALVPRSRIKARSSATGSHLPRSNCSIREIHPDSELIGLKVTRFYYSLFEYLPEFVRRNLPALKRACHGFDISTLRGLVRRVPPAAPVTGATRIIREFKPFTGRVQREKLESHCGIGKTSRHGRPPEQAELSQNPAGEPPVGGVGFFLPWKVPRASWRIPLSQCIQSGRESDV